MTSFKFVELNGLIRDALLQAQLEGDFNWQSDVRLANRIRVRFGHWVKEDDVRRVCSDLAMGGRIYKFPRKSLYKYRGVAYA